MNRWLLVLVVLLFSTFGTAQVRFYAQYKGIPFNNGFSSQFNVLTGVHLDPNKEILLGWGVSGSFRPKELSGDLKFSKNAVSLSFNWYVTRGFYYNFGVNLNLIKGIISDLDLSNPIIGTSQNLINRFFFDYEVQTTFVLFRRFHLSFGTTAAAFAKLVKDTSVDFLEGKFQPDISLSLKVYVFQIKY